MAFRYSDPYILQALKSGDIHTYNFVEIGLTEEGFNPIHITDYPEDITLSGITYNSALLKSVAPPPKSGELSQEIQRIEISNVMSELYGNRSSDLIIALGNKWHGAPCIVKTYVWNQDTNQIIEDDPLNISRGILKTAVRGASDDTVVLDIIGTFSQLGLIQELRTSPGSLRARNKEDTSFDRAGNELKDITLEWGTK